MRTKQAVQILLSTFIAVSYMASESQQDPIRYSSATCDNVARQVEVCAKPLMDVLQGTIEKWPRSEKEVENYCEKYAGSERCIRDFGRKCTKGLQRTILSTVANSVQRVRKRECQRSKYSLLLKTFECIEKNQVPIRNLVANATSKLSVVETQMKDPDQKTMALCCLVNEIENDIKRHLSVKFPTESKVVVSMYRAVLEDVIELVCRAPKCNDIFRGYKIPKTRPEAGIINIMLNIMFSLDAEV